MGRIRDIAGSIAIKNSRTQVASGLVALLVFFLIQQLLLARAHPDALYMDSLRLLAQLQDWQEGRLPTLDFWGQASAHRGFINQAFLLANVEWFDLDVMLANRATTLVILAVSAFLVMAWSRDAREQAMATQRPLGLLQLAVTLAFAALCFSWAGVELLTLDLGLPLWTKNLCFILFFAGHAWLLSGRAKRAWLLQFSLSVAAPLIVLLVGMGWNYAFAVAVLAMQAFAFLPRWRESGRWRALLPGLLLLFSIAAYVGTGQVVNAEADSARLSLSGKTVMLPFYALGTTFGGHEALLRGGRPYEVLLVLGIIVVAAGAVALWSWLRRGAPGSRLPLYLVLYGGLVAVSVAIARGIEGPGAVIASRYYMDLVLLLIGVLWMVAREAAATPLPQRPRATAAAAVLLGMVAMGHAWTYAHEWRAGPFREWVFAGMKKAILRGVPDEEAASLLQSPIAQARKGVNVMREKRLALFVDLPGDYCQTGRIRYDGGWNKAETSGRWSAEAPELVVPSCECSFAADVYLPASMPARVVRVTGSDGVERVTHVPPGSIARVDLGPGSGDGRVRMQVSPTTIPSRDIPGNQDTRVLGVMVNGISVACASGVGE